ncbi:MAG: HAD family hydrolase [Gordonia sp. (in: high G+C Gram-positive bacteria)]|uniref:HAD family hydrolase n=1 Tax=Gordonia sp. (in: high G+C Gram-positive bacteria) TaxID=84139 RepID=UPI003BB74401
MPDGIRVVVFDVGETLVDESRMWTQLAESAGVTPFTSMGLIGALAARDEPHQKVWEILGVAPPPGREDFEADDLYPDALDCLSAARDAGFTVGIAGNQPAGAAEHLRALGVDVDFVASSAQWGVTKPAVDFFARIVDVAGCEPHVLLYVGERLDNDIVPAATAGLRTAFLRRGPWAHIHTLRADAVRPDLQLDSLDELTSLLTSGRGGPVGAMLAVHGKKQADPIRSDLRIRPPARTRSPTARRGTGHRHRHLGVLTTRPESPQHRHLDRARPTHRRSRNHAAAQL